MAVTVVQSKASPGGTYSGNFSSNLTAGNTVLFAVTGSAGTPNWAGVTSSPLIGGSPVSGATQILTDTSDDSTPANNDGGGSIWLLPNVIGGVTSFAITATNYGSGGSNVDCGIMAYEISGLGSSPVLDQIATSQATFNNTVTTGAITSAIEFVMLMMLQTTGSAPTGPGSGWTLGPDYGPPISATWYQIPSSSGGTYTSTLSTGGNILSSIVTIKPGAVSGPDLLMASFP